MEARRIIAWNVRTLRVQQVVTIEELADRAGLDVSTTARVDRGVINCTIGVVEKLARALHVTFSDLTAEPPKGSRMPKPLPSGPRPRAARNSVDKRTRS